MRRRPRSQSARRSSVPKLKARPAVKSNSYQERVDDVPAGRYRLHVRAEGPKPNGRGTRLIAVAEIDVKLPDMPEGRSDEPLDVGDLHPKPVAQP